MIYPLFKNLVPVLLFNISTEWCNDHDNLVITKGNDFGVPRKVKRFSINKRKLLPLMQEDDVRYGSQFLYEVHSAMVSNRC